MNYLNRIHKNKYTVATRITCTVTVIPLLRKLQKDLRNFPDSKQRIKCMLQYVQSILSIRVLIPAFICLSFTRQNDVWAELGLQAWFMTSLVQSQSWSSIIHKQMWLQCTNTEKWLYSEVGEIHCEFVSSETVLSIKTRTVIQSMIFYIESPAAVHTDLQSLLALYRYIH